MKERLVEYLVCPRSGKPLELRINKRDQEEILEGLLVSPDGTEYPIRRGIPRFVSSEEYTDTFGFQWNKHSRIYFDNKDQHRVCSTYDQLQTKLGLSSQKVKDQTVLDVGCGTGANGAAISEWGAREVFCVDLSSAVEAAYANTKSLDNVHVIQANLFSLPFRHDSFDIIYSIGVLMTTPDTKKAFLSLVPFLKENGVVSIWLYEDVPDLSQRLSDRLRFVTTRMNPKILYGLCWLAVPAYYVYKIPFLGKAVFHFLPPISKEPFWEDRVLDTFDWYSPKYQWKHTYPEVHGWFREANLTDIHLQPVPVAVWGRKSMKAERSFTVRPNHDGEETADHQTVSV
jgi:SAM-dependent methyltransferase